LLRLRFEACSKPSASRHACPIPSPEDVRGHYLVREIPRRSRPIVRRSPRARARAASRWPRASMSCRRGTARHHAAHGCTAGSPNAPDACRCRTPSSRRAPCRPRGFVCCRGQRACAHHDGTAISRRRDNYCAGGGGDAASRQWSQQSHGTAEAYSRCARRTPDVLPERPRAGAHAAERRPGTMPVKPVRPAPC
jgi:hypothetical protein